MTKALFKKQMMEVFSWLYKDRKTGKRRSAKGVALYILLYLFLFGFLGSWFYVLANTLCAPLVSAGMGWLYWCLMGILSLFLGVFGSVFSTYASLYQAKDNDLLLSMPVPAAKVLLTRLLGVYVIGTMYLLIAIIPAQIAWLLTAPFSGAGTVWVVLIPVVLSVLVLVLSTVLGWLVALISGRVKHKNIITVLLSLAFIGGYYYVCGQSYFILQEILLNAQALGDKMKLALYPLYHMGLAAEGSFLSMLICIAIVGILFAVVYTVLSRSFLKLATTNRGGAKTVYKERKAEKRSVGGALLQKELRRFTGSANYMLNCGLGVLLMPIAAVMVVWKADQLREILIQPMIQPYIPLLAVAAVCVIATMNDMTAPSVSLEGKSLWLLQSFPVSGWQVLKAKLKLHLLLTLIPAALLVVAVEWLVKPTLFYAVMIPVAAALFIVLMGIIGLTVNLKMPNLNWTSEIVPIKQSAGVVIALFGGWVILAALGVVFFLVKNVLSVGAFLLLACAVLFVCCRLLVSWLMTKGAKIFETL